MAKRILLVIGLAIGLTLGTAAAGAQQYPPGCCSITLSPTSVPPGGTLTVTGQMTPGSTELTFTVFSDPIVLGSIAPNPDGSFTAEATLPSDIDSGAHTMLVEDDLGGAASASFTVTGAAGDDDGDDDGDDAGVHAGAGTAAGAAGAGVSGAGGLPVTGSDSSLPLFRIGAVLLAGGGLLVFLTRRQRQASDEATVSV